MDAISAHEHVPLDLRPVLELYSDAVPGLRKTSAALAQVERARPDVLEEYPVQRRPVYGDGGMAVLHLDLMEVKAEEHPVFFVVYLNTLQRDAAAHHGVAETEPFEYQQGVRRYPDALPDGLHLGCRLVHMCVEALPLQRYSRCEAANAATDSEDLHHDVPGVPGN